MTTIDTKSVARRELRLDSVEQLRAEIERTTAAVREGRATALGNWSIAQILQHLGKWWRFSFDGFPFRYPWPMRVFAWPMKRVAFRWMYRMAMRPGFRNPEQVAAGEPDADVSLDDAALLLGQLDRLRAGERMTATNPMVGHFSHDEWVFVHLRHAELHLSFVRVGDEPRPTMSE